MPWIVKRISFTIQYPFMDSLRDLCLRQILLTDALGEALCGCVPAAPRLGGGGSSIDVGALDADRLLIRISRPFPS